MPDQKMPRTDTEYAGTVPTTNSVQSLGVYDDRELDNSEKLRLSYLTGQMEDPDAPAKSGFMGGVDPDYPFPGNPEAYGG